MNRKLKQNPGNNTKPSENIMYFKFVGPYSLIAQNKIRTLIKKCCKPNEDKLVFSSFKLQDVFSTKDKLPMFKKPSVVYKFTCACKASYIGEASHRLNTRIIAHLGKDKNSHVFKYLQSSENCFRLCTNLLAEEN